MHLSRSDLRIVVAVGAALLLQACSKKVESVESAAAATAASAPPSDEAAKVDTTLTSTPVAAPKSELSSAEMEELVQRFDDDLRANPNIPDIDRRALARQLAAEFAKIAADWHADEPRRLAAEQAFTAQYGTVDQVKAKECVELRAGLAALERYRSGASNAPITDEERAGLPQEIARVQVRISQMCV